MAQPFRIGSYEVQPDLLRIVKGDDTFHLEPKAMEVLVFLAERPKRVISKEQIIGVVWQDAFVTDDVLIHAISQLRKAFSDDPKNPNVIQTIPKRGYRFLLPISQVEETLSTEAEKKPREVNWKLVGHQRTKIWRRLIPWSVTVLIVFTVGLVIWRSWSDQPRSLNTRFVIDLPPGHQFSSRGLSTLSFSPDGQRLVYVAEYEGQRRLCIHRFDEFGPQPIIGTEGASAPFFSPDGRWIGFLSPGGLFKVSATGGTPVRICPVTSLGDSPGASWGPDGTIVFTGGFRTYSKHPEAILWRKTLEQPYAVRLTAFDRERNEDSHLWPEMLPDGRGVLFTAGDSLGRSPYQITLLSFETGETSALVGGVAPQWVQTGHIVYAWLDSLLAVPFDLQHQQLRGPPVTVLDGVYWRSGGPLFAVSSTGNLAYVPDESGYGDTLVRVDRRGVATRLLEHRDSHFFVHPRVSPDGKKVVAVSYAQGVRSAEGRSWDLVVYDLESEKRRLVTTVGDDLNPVWTPDAEGIIWTAVSADRTLGRIVTQPADGRGRPSVLQLGGDFGSISPDGRFLAFKNYDKGEGIWVIPLEGDSDPWPLLDAQVGGSPTFSPDGNWLAYTLYETEGDLKLDSGRPMPTQREVYVCAFPSSKQSYRISTDGGSDPRWSSDGKELFYVRDQSKFFVVSITTEPTFNAGQPELLFERDCKLGWDVFPDGEHFVVVQPPEKPTQINVILNWTEELKRLVHTDH